jgi:nitroreductase
MVGSPRTMNSVANNDSALWHSLLTVACCSPSPHNVQPWRVRILPDDEAELSIDGTRTLPNEDLTGSFLLSAMGMFLEALHLAAADHALRLKIDFRNTAAWFAERICDKGFKGLTPFAHLRLVPDAGAAPLYAPSLLQVRRTSRISLRRDPVTQEYVDTLSRLAKVSGHSYAHVVDPADIEAILEQNIFAVFHDMNVPAYHDEITEWFRFTDRSASRHRDGLDWRCMNVSRAEFWISARMSRVLLFPPARFFFKRRYRKQLGTVPAIGILSGDFFLAENAIESGRFLLRFWLEITRLGLYLHPYGNLVTNPQARAWLENRTGVTKPWLVFKLGYSDAPPKSFRRNLADVLISNPGGVA